MELVGIKLWGSTPLEVAHGGSFFRHNESALKLTTLLVINTEVGRQVHGAFHAFRNEYKRSIGKHSAVECGEEIVTRGDDGTKIFFDEFRMFLDRFTEGTEDNAFFSEAIFIGRGNGYRIKYDVYCHSS